MFYFYEHTSHMFLNRGWCNIANLDLVLSLITSLLVHTCLYLNRSDQIDEISETRKENDVMLVQKLKQTFVYWLVYL